MTEFRPGGLELTGRAAALAGLVAGDAVLDVGCGLGTSLEYLRESLGVLPRGVDISEEAVRRAGRSYITQGDACRLPFGDGSFDAVLMECVLTLTAEPERALSEAARVLREGGRLILGTLSVHGAAALMDSGRADVDRLEAELARTGLRLLHTEDRSDCLRRFVGELIFRYGSLEAYMDIAGRELAGSTAGCGRLPKDTGYTLLIAQKPRR